MRPINDYEMEEKFPIPRKLFGRKKELKLILSTFRQSRLGAKKIILVSGQPGIGKTALIDEARKLAAKRPVYFIRGKFEQFGRNVPYGGLIRAFQELMSRLVSESAEKREAWKEKIQRALGPNGQVIINVIPELESIMGKQPRVPELGPLENQNRFQLCFQKFSAVFGAEKHPVVLFLDDLQWADIASLSLLKALLTDPAITYFLFIGAYRDSGVTEAHPLSLTVNEIKKMNIPVKDIRLDSLTVPDVEQMIAASFHCDSEKAFPLAELVCQKTNGNPFFIYKFLKSLINQDILRWVEPLMNENWDWDLQKVSALESTENVGELLTAEISTLSEGAREALKLGACIGNSFTLDIMALLAEKSKYDTFSTFSPLVRGGFLYYAGGNYYFAHDRIQETVYSLIPDDKKKMIHYRIAVLLLANKKEQDLGKNIFMVMDQLNAGLEFVTKKEERLRYAKLNLRAGKKALDSSAYEAALGYLQAGIILLGDTGWPDAYVLSLQLYTYAAEAAYVCRDFGLTEKLTAAVKNKAQALLDTIKVYEIEIQSYFARNKLRESIHSGLIILRSLGVRLPEKPHKPHVLLALIKTRFALRKRSMQYFYRLPRMTDPHKIAAIRLMLDIGTAAYFTVPNLIPLMVFKVLHMCVRYGNSPDSSFYYMAYAFILRGVLGKIESAYNFGEFALRVLKNTEADWLYAKVHLTFNIFINHWKNPLKDTLSPLREGYQKGLETGDLESAATCALVYCLHLFYSGEKLTRVNTEMLKYYNAVMNLKQERSLNTIGLSRQLVSNLMEDSSRGSVLIGESFNEKEMLPLFYKAKDRQSIAGVYYCKSILGYLFYDYKEALRNVRKAKPYMKSLNATFHIPVYCFYSTLLLASVYPSCSIWQRMKFFFILHGNRKKIMGWAKYAPKNHSDKFYLVEAELARVSGRKQQAGEYFEKAIVLARQNGIKNEEALANELAAQFQFSLGRTALAAAYLKEARRCYLEWDAYAKVKHLEERFPKLLEPVR